MLIKLKESLQSRDIVVFLGLWESLHNPNFKRIDFDTFKEDAGSNAYVFSIKKDINFLKAIFGLLENDDEKLKLDDTLESMENTVKKFYLTPAWSGSIL